MRYHEKAGTRYPKLFMDGGVKNYFSFDKKLPGRKTALANRHALVNIDTGIPKLKTQLFKAMGRGMEDKSFADYPTGYWGCNVIAIDEEKEQWVVRFDKTYGDLWKSGWRFDDEPDRNCTLQFERTGREIVYEGQIEASDGFYEFRRYALATKAKRRKRSKEGTWYQVPDSDSWANVRSSPNKKRSPSKRPSGMRRNPKRRK